MLAETALLCVGGWLHAALLMERSAFSLHGDNWLWIRDVARRSRQAMCGQAACSFISILLYCISSSLEQEPAWVSKVCAVSYLITTLEPPSDGGRVVLVCVG